MGLAQIKLKLTPGGNPEAVVVNGQDISNSVFGVRLVAEASGSSRIPQVTLILNSSVELEGEGIVQLETPAADVDPDEVLGAFLSSIDTEELEARALAGMEGLGGPETTGQSFLRALKEMAGVDDNGA